jgi:hypothetical protein
MKLTKVDKNLPLNFVKFRAELLNCVNLKLKSTNFEFWKNEGDIINYEELIVEV